MIQVGKGGTTLRRVVSPIKTHGAMRIIQTVSTVLTSFGTLEIKVTQVKGLRLRKLVLVKK